MATQIEDNHRKSSIPQLRKSHRRQSNSSLFASPKSSPLSFRILEAAFVILALSLPTALSSLPSFWIDEALQWRISSHETLGQVWDQIWRSGEAGSSLSQVPGYIIYTWFWYSVAPSSEFWSRLANLPWVLLLAVAWIYLGRLVYPTDLKKRATLLLLLLVAPFFLRYATEFRPYAALVALGAVSALGIGAAERGKVWGPWVATGALLLATALHMTAAVALPFVIAYIFYQSISGSAAYKELRLVKYGAVVGLLGLPMALYYGRTLLLGASGVPHEASWKNLAFILYEFAGFQGLGPSRDVLHVRSAISTFVEWLPLLGLLGFPIVFLVGRRLYHGDIVGLFQVDSLGSKVVRLSSGITLWCVLALWVVALVVGWRILGRHVALVYPMFLLAGAVLMLGRDETSWYRVDVALVSILIFGQIFSSYRLFSLPYYARDDYRSAVSTAAEHTRPGELLVLVGSCPAFQYYLQGYEPSERLCDTRSRSLNIQDPETNSSWNIALFGSSPTAEEWQQLIRSDSNAITIAFTRPYQYDRRYIVRCWLQRKQSAERVATPPWFEIWRVEAE